MIASWKEYLMRRYVIGALCLLAVLSKAEPIVALDLHGLGKSVVDGDEFVFCEGPRCMNIRLCGIDTPSKGKSSYNAAVEALSKLVLNQQVVCRPVNEGSVCDGISGSTSRGRTIAQ